MPKQDSTPPPASVGRVENTSAPASYCVGEVIVFKYEGNVRAEVTGHQVVGGRVWVAARAAELTFLVPAHMVVGLEPKEVL